MLRSLNLMKGLPLRSLDGEAGSVDSVLLDAQWVVRYLVLNADERLGGKRVLISPVAIEAPEGGGDLRVRVTQEQLQECPDFSLEEPVTRERERGYLRFFAWPLYWGGGYSTGWTGGAYPGMIAATPLASDPTPDTGTGVVEPGDGADGPSHLHQAATYRGYRVLAADGSEVGQVDDFLLDDRSWTIPYVAVHTGGVLGGHRVLVPRESFDGWADGKVGLQLPPEVLRTAPAWEPLEPVNDTYESRVRAHFGLPHRTGTAPETEAQSDEWEEEPAPHR